MRKRERKKRERKRIGRRNVLKKKEDALIITLSIDATIVIELCSAASDNHKKKVAKSLIFDINVLLNYSEVLFETSKLDYLLIK